MENFPYEPEERGSDYVRLASIAAGKMKQVFSPHRCELDHNMGRANW